jgi:formate dehydrogenase assembly factor FdhD
MILKAPMDLSRSIRTFSFCMKDSVKRFQVGKLSDGERKEEETFVIAERRVILFLNDQEGVTLLATPENLKEFAVGFMLSSGWLRQDKAIERIDVNPEGLVRGRVN